MGAKEICILLGIFTIIVFLLKEAVVNHEFKRFLYIGVYFIIVAYLYFTFKLSFTRIILLYIVVPATLIGLIWGGKEYEKPAKPVSDIKIISGKNIFLRNVFAGIGIFGGTGSGKTASIIARLLKHFSEYEFAGIIYDYKDGELTEICLPLFPKMKIIAIHRPDISLRVNPIDPKYMTDEKEVTAVTKVILDNLKGSNQNDNFFDKTAESLLSSIILKFALDHKAFCSLPYVIAFILSVDFSFKAEKKNKLSEDAFDTFLGLKKFLISNPRVKIQASAFILGLASEKQTAGVVSTLANSLREISYPQSFWVLSGNDFDLGINAENNRTVLSVLNEPKTEEALNPLIATIIHTVTKQMMVRNRKHSFVLLDEAPTLKFKNMARMVATMRSFNVCTVYCAQDIVQGVQQYGREGFKAILSNLSSLFLGRVNDPDSGKFYEGYFELIKIKTKSKTQGGNGSSTTIGEREVAKTRAYEFTKFKPGKFAFVSSGKAEIIQFPVPKNEKQEFQNEPEKMNSIVVNNYNKIISDISIFAKEIGITEE